MGFLANAWNYGWTAGSIITKAEKEADRICRNIKTTVIPDPEDEMEIEKGDVGTAKIIFHPEIFRQLMGYDWNDQEENDNYESGVINGNFDTNAASGNGETHTLKIYDDRFDALDVKRNIAAAVNHFGIGSNGDIGVIRNQIAATLYIAGLVDTDAVFEALNKDSTAYAAVNERVRMYTGEPMDERLIRMGIDKDTDGTALEMLELLTDWELEYLTERISPADVDGLPGSIREAHMDIMNRLNGQGKREEDMAEVIAAGGGEDV